VMPHARAIEVRCSRRSVPMPRPCQSSATTKATSARVGGPPPRRAPSIARCPGPAPRRPRDERRPVRPRARSPARQNELAPGGSAILETTDSGGGKEQRIKVFMGYELKSFAGVIIRMLLCSCASRPPCAMTE
jgi:hypothetical protein